jgi:Response regulator
MSSVAPVVCLVDDDASVRKSVARFLESSGFKVDTFSEPEAFLGHLTAHSVPVAILDIWMENMTGMELLAHLCARSPKTRVIFITAHEDYAAELPSGRPVLSLSSSSLLTTSDFWPPCEMPLTGRLRKRRHRPNPNRRDHSPFLSI